MFCETCKQHEKTPHQLTRPLHLKSHHLLQEVVFSLRSLDVLSSLNILLWLLINDVLLFFFVVTVFPWLCRLLVTAGEALWCCSTFNKQEPRVAHVAISPTTNLFHLNGDQLWGWNAVVVKLLESIALLQVSFRVTQGTSWIITKSMKPSNLMFSTQVACQLPNVAYVCEKCVS